MGALAHFIGNKDNKSWNYLGKHMATCTAYSPGKTWDGHASGEMHAFFNILGAARADEKDFRSFLDYYKTLIVLSETHDGKGLVEQPFGTERYGNCSGIARDRKVFSYTTVLLFSIPKRVLLITGADYAAPATATVANPASVASPFARPPEPERRAARTLSPEKQAMLDNALKRTLIALSADAALMPTPFVISISPRAVWLKAAAADGTLTFQLEGSTQTADIGWDTFTPSDRGMLAQLVMKLKPDSSDAKAMAAVYLESFGKVEAADGLFNEAGEASRKKLESLLD
jgi:hypothetical protein